MSLETLIEISRHYGANPDYVLAGGGNTSWKDSETLYVKSSGMSLADVTADSFVKMDRSALARIWEKTYPESPDERESAVLADMMAAKKIGEEQKRPSVEALLHDLLPFSFVVHLHPALVNGLTCAQQGEALASEIFGADAIWIPITNPGYILARTVKTAMDEYSATQGKPAAIIILQNHGVFVGDNSVDGIKEIYSEIMRKLGERVKRQPDFSGEKRFPAAAQINDTAAAEIARTLAELSGAAAFMQSAEISALVKDRDSFAPVSSAFSPDHIVYAGSCPLFTSVLTAAAIQDVWKEHTDKTGRAAKIVAVKELGIFSAAANEKTANLALDLFKDTIKVAVYSESFGGPLFMTADKIDFINNWEVERFRTNVLSK